MYNVWHNAIGSREEFSHEERTTNAIMLMSFIVISGYLLVAIFAGVEHAPGMLLAMMASLGGFYYIARFRRMTQLAVFLFGGIGYLGMIVNYFFNEGIDGPTILIFFVAYNTMIAVTAPRFNLLWVLLSIVLVGYLLWFEYHNPASIPDTYESREMRFIDIFGTYVISIGFISLVTGFLRSGYISERKKAEDHARQIEVQNRQISEQNDKLKALIQERDKLFSIVSHDMLGPLSSIQSYLELVTEAPELDEMEMKKELLNLTKNTSGMLRNILTWSKNQLQGVQVRKAEVDVNSVVSKILNIQGPIAATKSIDITLQMAGDLHTTTDAEMLILVVRNLINNAVKFTPAGGTVTVNTERKGNECLVRVKDTGIGMTKEQQQTLFTPEVKSTYGTNNEKGVGLGLSLCYEFIKLLGGRIEVESRPGEGSVFSVYLPAA